MIMAAKRSSDSQSEDYAQGNPCGKSLPPNKRNPNMSYYEPKISSNVMCNPDQRHPASEMNQQAAEDSAVPHMRTHITMETNPTQEPQTKKTGFVENRDKRRQNRIQGGWKGGSGGRGGTSLGGRGVGRGGQGRGGVGNGSKNSMPHPGAYGQFQPCPPSRPAQRSYPQQTGYECDDDRNLGQPRDLGSSAFVYQTPDIEVKKEDLPDEIELNEDKAYPISCTEHAGESRIQLFSKFIPEDEAAQMFERLHREVNWNRRMIKKPEGGQYAEPRKTFWFGELPYSYSKVTLESCNQWHPIIWDLKQRIEANTPFTFNSVLCNLYEGCKDGVQWHSDDEYSLGDKPVIASVSLGATRRFQLRDKNGKFAANPARGEYVIHLTSGSLLLMMGATQDDWQHRVPKEYHDRGPRINLTFRTIHPDDRWTRPTYSDEENW